MLAAFLLVVAVLASACDDEGPAVATRTEPPSEPSGAATSDPGPPEAPSVAGQPEPVAGTLGDAVTVTGVDLFGTESATIEVTLSEPELITEQELDTGAVLRPQNDVFVVIEAVLVGVEGAYDFNPLHFRLVPAAEAAAWQGELEFDIETDVNQPEFYDELDAIGSAALSPGNRVSGNLVFDQPESALDGAAIVLRSLLLPDGPASAYWVLG